MQDQIPPTPGDQTPITPPPTSQTPPPPVEADKNARLWGTFCHLSALVGFVIPFGNILGPLVVWLIKRNDIPFVDDQGKESLNFQITLTIALFVAMILILLIIGIPLLFIIGIYGVIMVIIASLKANEGYKYRYPFTLRLIK